jgi:hypothetical protein
MFPDWGPTSKSNSLQNVPFSNSHLDLRWLRKWLEDCEGSKGQHIFPDRRVAGYLVNTQEDW